VRAGGWALAVWQTPRARIGQIGSCRTALVLALFATLSAGNAFGGRIEVEPHHYLWDQGYVLMVLGPYATSGDAYGVAFVASPSKGITEIRAGKYANIRESEGCT
jgi:hypothetical protein